MLLNVQDISFGFSPEKQIFTNLTLHIDQGLIYALMGGNGSGKTTLFNIITGFHKVGLGGIFFKDNDITNADPYKINRMGICRTFQDLRLISKLTVRENILLAMPGNPTDSWVKALLPATVFKDDLHSLEGIADKVTESFFLKEVQHSPAGEISFGQQKLLNLACCVANGAELLLLDEPVAGISPHYRDQMTLLIQQLKQQGKTILMIEHNTDFVTGTADRFLFMDEGKISAFDTYIQLKNSDQAANAYF